MLHPQSLEALAAAPSPRNRSLRLCADIADEDLGESAFVCNALVVLERAAERGWLRLTPKGNFSLDTVAALRESMAWPGMWATEHFRTGKKLRERDVWELHLLHRLLALAGLIEERQTLCQLTALGHEMIEPGRRSALQALLFRHLFWRLNLSNYIQTFPRGLPGTWPQDDIGSILWGLSCAAEDWRSADMLIALTAIRDDSVASVHWNAEGTMYVWRVLWPLRWFGMLDYRGPEVSSDVAWRKTSLFDRFLSFDVRLTESRVKRH